MVTLTTTMMVVDGPNNTNDAVRFSIIGGGLTMREEMVTLTTTMTMVHVVVLLMMMMIMKRAISMTTFE